jgi:hypothetical protein
LHDHNNKEKGMNWEAVGAVAEILGSLAVIGTIFYLAVQVGHAAAIAKATTQQSAAQMSIDAMALTLDSQILSSASRKATTGEELNPEELSNYLRWVWVRMRVAGNAYYQYQQGLLESEVWRGYSVTIIAHIGPGAVAEPHWERVSPSYPQSFLDEVERILEWAKMHGERPVTERRSEYIDMLEKK